MAVISSPVYDPITTATNLANAYVAPTKALAQDQLSSLLALGVPDLRATTHDGDSSREQRDWARKSHSLNAVSWGAIA